MHELSLAEDMLEMIVQRSQDDGFERVTKVWLEVGMLSHVEADAMVFCFDAVMSGTLVEGATLEILPTQGIGECQQCQQTTHIEHLYDPCESCGAFGLKIVQGDQVNIKSLAVV